MGLAFARRSLSLRVRVARDGTSRVLVTHMSSPEALVWELRDSDTREDTVVDLFKSAETSRVHAYSLLHHMDRRWTMCTGAAEGRKTRPGLGWSGNAPYGVCESDVLSARNSHLALR